MGESPQFSRMRRFTRLMSTAGVGVVISRLRHSIDAGRGGLGTFDRGTATPTAVSNHVTIFIQYSQPIVQ